MDTGLHHTAISLNLAPSDTRLFLKMKKELKGGHFDTADDVIVAVDHFLEVQYADFYKEVICVLHKVCECRRGLC